MKLVRFFANFEGRIPRKTFWLANIAVLIIDVIVATIASATAEVFAGETAGYMTMHIVTVAFFYPQLVIALKQAHDLNMSNRTIYAWYIAVIVDYVVMCGRRPLVKGFWLSACGRVQVMCPACLRGAHGRWP